MIIAYNEGICVEFWNKQKHNLGLPPFKLPASTKTKTTPLYIILTISVYDY